MPDYVWIQEVVFPILGMGIGVLVLTGVYRTVNRWIDRRHERVLTGSGAVPAEELEAVRRRLDVLDDVAFRMQELEERVDFTERMLAQRRSAEAPRLLDRKGDA